MTPIPVRLHTCLNLSNSSDISLEILFDFPLISGKVPWVFKERIGSIRFYLIMGKSNQSLFRLLLHWGKSKETKEEKYMKRGIWIFPILFNTNCGTNNCFAMQAISCPMFWPFWSRFLKKRKNTLETKCLLDKVCWKMW